MVTTGFARSGALEPAFWDFYITHTWESVESGEAVEFLLTKIRR
jgi:hypothetical protein